MNNKLFFTAVSLACAALIGCEPDIHRASSEFFYPSSFSADTGYFFRDAKEILLRFSSSNNYSPSYGGSSKERYKQYVYYFGDFGYREDDEVCFGCCDDVEDIGFGRPTSLCVCDIKSIHVVCENEFDENHPAGSNADDLFKIGLETAYPFLKNNYTGYYEYYDKYFPLQDINPDYLKLTGLWFGHLIITKNPHAEGKYSFTISVEMDADPVSGNVPKFSPQTVTLIF